MGLETFLRQNNTKRLNNSFVWVVKIRLRKNEGEKLICLRIIAVFDDVLVSHQCPIWNFSRTDNLAGD